MIRIQLNFVPIKDNEDTNVIDTDESEIDIRNYNFHFQKTQKKMSRKSFKLNHPELKKRRCKKNCFLQHKYAFIFHISRFFVSLSFTLSKQRYTQFSPSSLEWSFLPPLLFLQNVDLFSGSMLKIKDKLGYGVTIFCQLCNKYWV